MWQEVISPLLGVLTPLADVLDAEVPEIDAETWLNARGPRIQRFMRPLRVASKEGAKWFGITTFGPFVFASLASGRSFVADLRGASAYEELSDEDQDAVLEVLREEQEEAQSQEADEKLEPVEVPPATKKPGTQAPKQSQKPGAETPDEESLPAALTPPSLGQGIWLVTGLIAALTALTAYKQLPR